MSRPVLCAPDFGKPFIIQTDSSQVGLGVVLAQVDSDGQEHPVLYLSRKMTGAEKNYSVTEQECLAIIFALKKLHCYLDGQEFVIMTDHNPLVWLRKNCSNNQRLLRWMLTIQAFNFDIKHRAGRANANADCLSRLIK